MLIEKKADSIVYVNIGRTMRPELIARSVFSSKLKKIS